MQPLFYAQSILDSIESNYVSFQLLVENAFSTEKHNFNSHINKEGKTTVVRE